MTKQQLQRQLDNRCAGLRVEERASGNYIGIEIYAPDGFRFAGDAVHSYVMDWVVGTGTLPELSAPARSRIYGGHRERSSRSCCEAE